MSSPRTQYYLTLTHHLLTFNHHLPNSEHALQSTKLGQHVYYAPQDGQKEARASNSFWEAAYKGQQTLLPRN